LSNNLVYIHELPLRSAFLEELADAADDFPRALSVFHDSRSSRARLFDVWSVACEPAQASISVGAGSGDWLIHFVRQGSGQLSHGSHPADAREIRLRLTQSLQGLFRPLAFGHVDRCAHVFKEIAGQVANGMPCRPNILNFSPRKDYSEDHVKVRTFLWPFKKDFSAHPISILWMNALIKRLV